MAKAASDAELIEALIESWVIFRDSGDWDRFAELWGPQAVMCTTWFRGPADEFIELCRSAFERGVDVVHQLGGTVVDVCGDRAVAQTKMTIVQRAELDGVVVDVSCHGRFYDFLTYAEEWRLIRRQPIYERDRLDPVVPGTAVAIDAEVAQRFPPGYRFLGYLHTSQGFDVRMDLPGRTGSSVLRLYEQGEQWLSGADRAAVWAEDDQPGHRHGLTPEIG